MRIRTFSDPVLRRPAAPIKHATGATRRLAAQMAETMRKSKGVGLAAPQVGASSRLIVTDVGAGLNVLVNPVITAASGAAIDWEGCLSFPGLLAEVERAEKVTVQSLGLDGKTRWVEGEGFSARVLQHEIDHLDGIVILDRARSVEKLDPADPSPEAEVETESRAAAHPLRVAFMGTPEFALPTLEALVAAGHSVVGVVTRPDRPAGRGGKTVRRSPVKLTALAFGLPVWEEAGRRVRESLPEVLGRWEAEVAVVVAYGVILPPEVLAGPKFGCVNLHPSLLPDYRGPAPIQRVIMDGRAITGVTVTQMDEGVDTGDIIAQREVAIGAAETAGSLHDRLANVGADLVVHVLDLLAAGKVAPRPQPPGRARPAPRLCPADEIIDWRRPAEHIARQVRALAPAPGAHAVFAGRRVKVLEAETVGEAAGQPGPDLGLGAGTGVSAAGRVIAFDQGSPVVGTGRGALVLRAVQPAGGSRMSGPDFVNGYRVGQGDRFDAEAPV